MLRKRLFGLLVAVIVTPLSTSAFACSCLAYPADEAEAVARAWPETDVVFAGKVVAIKPATPGQGRWTKVTFEVSDTWKGTDGDGQLVVTTASDSAMCGYPFKAGERYVVFANRRPQSDELTTSLCSLNRLEGTAEKLKHELDKAKHSDPGEP